MSNSYFYKITYNHFGTYGTVGVLSCYLPASYCRYWPYSPLLHRIKFNLFVCSPFGEYELDLDVQSFDDEDSTERKRIAFEIENGADEVTAPIEYSNLL